MGVEQSLILRPDEPLRELLVCVLVGGLYYDQSWCCVVVLCRGVVAVAGGFGLPQIIPPNNRITQ